MAAHNDVAYVINRNGHTRSELNFDPGPGTSSSQSSFAAELAGSARQVLGQGFRRAGRAGAVSAAQPS
jgi:hypothetical protein